MTAKMEMKNMEIRQMKLGDVLKQDVQTEYSRGKTWDTTRHSSGRGHALERLASQKALGIVRTACGYGRSYGAKHAHATWLHLDITDEEIVQAVNYHARNASSNLFIRSCPENPRPGVLESFRLNLGDGKTNISPIMVLRDNMRELDPNGCIMIMDYYPATHSATLSTAGHITVGYGHNGVTAGNKGRTWSVNMVKPTYCSYLQYIEEMGDNNGDAEIEYVFQRFEASEENRRATKVEGHFVQYRAAETSALMTQWANVGEAVLEHRTEDAFPAVWPDDVTQVTPTSCMVIHTLDDVAKLEAVIERGEWPEQFVVFAPTMSTASHAACTARGAGIPYFKTYPRLSKTISLCGKAWSPKPYWGDFLRGVSIGYKHSSILKYEVGSYTHGEWLSVPFHQFITMPPNDAKETAICAGAFTGWLLKAATAVAVGETRHVRKKMSWEDQVILSTFSGVTMIDMENRRAYYENIDREVPNQENLQAILEWCLHIFDDYEWSSSYGGKAYATTTRKTLKVLERLQTFQQHATTLNFNRLVTAVGGANGLENAVHNCGHFFNKFANKEAFDAGTTGITINNISQGYPPVLLDAIGHVLDGEHEEPGRNNTFILVQEGIKNKKAPVETKNDWTYTMTDDDCQSEEWDFSISLNKFIQKSKAAPHIATRNVTLEPSPYPVPEEPEVLLTADYVLPWTVGSKVSKGDTVVWTMPDEIQSLDWLESGFVTSPVEKGTKFVVHSIQYADAEYPTCVSTSNFVMMPLVGCKVIPKPSDWSAQDWWDTLTTETQELIPKTDWLGEHLEDK